MSREFPDEIRPRTSMQDLRDIAAELDERLRQGQWNLPEPEPAQQRLFVLLTDARNGSTGDLDVAHVLREAGQGVGQERGVDRAGSREEQEAEEAEAQESQNRGVYRGCCGAGVRHRGGRVVMCGGAGAGAGAKRRAGAGGLGAGARAGAGAGPGARARGRAGAAPPSGPSLRRATPPSARRCPTRSRRSTRAPSATAAPLPKRRGTRRWTSEAEDDVSDLGSPRVILDDDVSELTEARA